MKLLLQPEFALRVGLPAVSTFAKPMQLLIRFHGHLELPGHHVVNFQ
jgi:hypothetical protein